MGSNSDPITLHKYLYANADPVDMVDPSGNFSLGSFSAASTISGTLTAINLGSSALDLYLIGTGERELTYRDVGFAVLIATGGAAAGKLINLLVKTKKAKKVLSALEENASQSAYLAAKNVRNWVPKNKHMRSSTSGTKAKFDTDDPEQVKSWVSEVLNSPRRLHLPNGDSTDSFQIIVDMGREIGVKGQRKIRVVVTDAGKIITAFPVHKQ